MKTVSFYELLGMFNDNKIPKKIKYEDDIYTYDEEVKDYVTAGLPLGLMGVMNDFDFLKEKIEIIEEDKDIEELSIRSNCLKDERGCYCSLNKHTRIIANKINELVIEVNKLKNK